MRHFRDLSIRSKLMTGFMLTSLAALLLTLAALRAQTQITGAAIYDSKGALFATYTRVTRGDTPGPVPRDGNWIDAQHIGVPRPAFFIGARVGTVTVRSALSELAVRRKRTVPVSGGVS